MTTELSSQQQRALDATGVEVRTDALTRVLYSTDASIYKIEPQAVAFPSSGAETGRLLAAAADAGLEITPRGAGTGLAGGAVGSGLVVDLARHNRSISDLDLERLTVRVGPGVVLDGLNAFLAPHGLWFGPDVATSSRATLGGMIGNNSSGAHAPVYGTTVDHVVALEVAVGRRRRRVGGPRPRRSRESSPGCRCARRRTRGRDRTAECRRVSPSDGLDTASIRHSDHPATSVGSFPGPKVRLRRSPRRFSRWWRGPGGAPSACSFSPRWREPCRPRWRWPRLEPAAVEHIDRILLDQTVGQRAFAAARALLELDDRPCESMLLVEFFDDADERLAELDRLGLGDRRLMVEDPTRQQLVWGLRKAGLSLLTGRAGSAKATACIEDVCVRPSQLPDYVDGLAAIMRPLGLEASFYGHAASGELHVRPVIDLHEAEGLERLRSVADEVSALCRSFGGSLAAEHGVGIARTEYLEEHLGPDLADAARRLKALFDPRGLMNPGKIVDSGRFQIDGDLRLGPDSKLEPVLVGELGFVDRDGSFVANLEQCNGCGGCLKEAPTMCPTFVATGEEASVDPRPRQYHPSRPRGSLRRRASALAGTLTGACELPVVQGLSHGMSVERRSRGAQGRVGGHSPRSPGRAALRPSCCGLRSPGPGGNGDSPDRQPGSRSGARPDAHEACPRCLC